VDVGQVELIRRKYAALGPLLDERSRRVWAATEASALGWGGVSAVATATGLARNTVHAGLKQLSGPARESAAEEVEGGSRIRRPGGGRKRLSEMDPGLLEALEALVEPTTRGDPMSPLRWTCKSTTQLATALAEQGHAISSGTVASLLHQLDYSLQGTLKTREGAAHPDRDEQFRYIARQTRAFQRRGLPVISVDTKKKELVGDFANAGREWQPQGKPERVRVHDFKDKKLGKVIPYGIYDLSANQGWVNVGLDHDTPQFAVQSIRDWWKRMGCRAYPSATELLIMADCGGSNGYRARLWKVALQRLANETGLKISVCHFPPGTSKWNKIEHRMFCHITQNWRGRPLISHEVVVNLIGNTTTRAGLVVRAKLDRRRYPMGVKVSDQELARVNLKPARFHGEWNYSLAPV
jgi:hypothetical protein